MKFLVALFSLVFAFFLADFLVGRGAEPFRAGLSNSGGSISAGVPFDHSLHGDSIGLDCASCHSGSRSQAKAYFPSKKDCMDCHRLPLTENPGIETLDSALARAPEKPWSRKSNLPDHVVFHHGVHAAAGVNCSSCHGDVSKNIYGGEKFDMKTCLQCHRGETNADMGYKPASTNCASCHR
ncbi:MULTISPECIES: cytochrome c3 family protein [unclassified Fibrobacter]|uniref:cytochrome c3 family protein n=1 Tax=unclassified Fibrobacter TaxID=2634177 RepID=UPI000D79FED8|nr:MULTISPECIES: cytochrome c3 family protein [unclassified Fibrobacter]PWJ68498.1 quinol:cytochrome c oxidoreductase pentaheme cytochrome subunit [Fibrobacter sp. UWR4]PZW72110.1 quinol:cytochrome c oxidoreductase pentaheme cytochrome subunit [Fibrobacter sp. UWR1]